MEWTILASIVAYCAAMTPLLYSRMVVHPSRFGEFWGFTPNQYLFVSTLFPLATFCTFSTLRFVVEGLKAPVGSTVAVVIDNWPSVMLLCLGVSSGVAIVVNFSSVMSIDKLQEPLASQVLDEIAQYHEAAEAAAPERQASLRSSLVSRARALHREVRTSLSVREDSAAALRDVRGLGLVHCVFDRQLQRQLHLTDRTLEVLNLLQLVVVLFVGLVLLYCCIIAALFVEVNPSTAWLAARGVILGASLFGFYTLLYRQHRAHLEDLGIKNVTVLQDVLVAALVLAVLVVSIVGSPGKQELSLGLVARVTPLIVLLGGFIASATKRDLLQELVGRDTRMGLQVLLAAIVLVIGTIAIAFAYPRVESQGSTRTSP